MFFIHTPDNELKQAPDEAALSRLIAGMVKADPDLLPGDLVVIRGETVSVTIERDPRIIIGAEAAPVAAPAPASEGAIVAELRSKDGVTLAALAAALNAPVEAVRGTLRRLQGRGLVTCTGRGQGAKWKAAPATVEGSEKGEA